MYVETWSHFGTVLYNIKPMLSPNNKKTCNQVIAWGFEQGNNYIGIDNAEIKFVRVWLKGITDLFSGQSKADLDACWWFLATLNISGNAADFQTSDGCIARGFYWYSNACHAELKPEPKPEPEPPEPPKPPPPEPPPPIPPPTPIPEANMFLQYAQYLDEYLLTLGVLKVIERGIVILLRNWLRLIGNFLIWLEKRGA